MRKRLAVAGVGMIVMMLTVTSSAMADPAVGPFQWMRFQTSNGSTFGWVNGSDSPSDANTRVLRLVLPPNGATCSDTNLGACSFGRAFSRASNNIRTPVGNQRNLSFEFAASNPATASTRINVFLSSGDFLFLIPDYCSKPVASSGGTWRRADFTGFKTGCAVVVNGPNATGGFTEVGCTTPAAPADEARFFCADGTDSAWKNFADANGDEVVIIRHLLVDSGGAPAAGTNTYWFDRVSLGAGKMYTEHPRRALNCPTENVC
ncbi:MAG: hypothetical protein QOJ13_1577 [Gaiellales bacterium]|jgi:hypothetical protein|nr:hypothetical protein [Gaiellales bacterium]